MRSWSTFLSILSCFSLLEVSAQTDLIKGGIISSPYSFSRNSGEGVISAALRVETTVYRIEEALSFSFETVELRS